METTTPTLTACGSTFHGVREANSLTLDDGCGWGELCSVRGLLAAMMGQAFDLIEGF